MFRVLCWLLYPVFVCYGVLAYGAGLGVFLADGQ